MHERISSGSATRTRLRLAPEIWPAAERRPGTASSSAATSAKNTARLMMLLRSERECAAISLRCSSGVTPAGGCSCCAAMHPILTCPLPEASRREAVAAAERAREVRGLAVADQARHVSDRDRRLLDQERRRSRHAAREQVLVEAH